MLHFPLKCQMAVSNAMDPSLNPLNPQSKPFFPPSLRTVCLDRLWMSPLVVEKLSFNITKKAEPRKTTGSSAPFDYL